MLIFPRMVTQRFSHLFRTILPLMAALFFAGCGGGDDAPVSNAPGPAVFSSFAGVTININPTLSFLSNGQLTYVNSVTGGAFPTAASAINGTYTYTPAADYLSGTLVVNLPGIGQVLNMTFQSFTTQGGKVTGFTTVYNGQSYNSTVTSGTLTPAAVAGGSANTGGSNSGGSNSGNAGTTIPTPVGANEALAPDIPSTMQGTYNLTFDYVQTGSPITAGTQKTFVIGAKSLTFDNKTLTGPVHRNSNPYEWIFKDGDLEYAASIRTDNKLNEINVAKTGGSPWYGQYRDTGGSGSSGSGSGSGSGGSSTSGSLTSSLYYHPNANVSVTQPYTSNQAVSFTLSSATIAGSTLAFSGKTLSNPTAGTPVNSYTSRTFTDSASGLTYEVTVDNNTTIVEIVVSNSSTWIGAFTTVNSSSNSGSGGSSGGNGTASFGSNGNFVAGTTFTHKVLSMTIEPAGSTAPAGFPTLAIDETVTFTIGSDGSLQFKGFSIPFKTREGNFNLYQLTAVGSGYTDSWLGTVALQPGDAGARVVLSFGRATISLTPTVTTFTYALD